MCYSGIVGFKLEQIIWLVRLSETMEKVAAHTKAQLIIIQIIYKL